jgi:aerobic-type carbon monoxide dehydrogenase small subunit (CoxS/CutS family)
MTQKPRKPKGVSRRDFIKGVSAGVAGAAVLGSGALLAGKDNPSQQEEIPGATQSVVFTVNGKKQALHVDPRATLLDTLRNRLNITGPKKVCDAGACGCCTVIYNGVPIYACMKLAADCQGAEITTVEGLGTPEKMSPLQEEFVAADALQCGFCTPGFVTTISAYLEKNPSPTLEEIREACRGNSCRCGTYPRVFEAALATARRMRGQR